MNHDTRYELGLAWPSAKVGKATKGSKKRTTRRAPAAKVSRPARSS
jgi:hypothetical protein